jgi:hypothetical protein
VNGVLAQDGFEPLAGDAYIAQIGRTDNPPVIDGILDDEAWADAPSFDNFLQVNPVEGGPPSERTVVRLLFDSENIYIGIRCLDSDPGRITATQLRRDAPLNADDRVGVTIDTFLDRSNGYFFETNPIGAKRDALLSNNMTERVEWDGIWYSRSNIDEEGWSVEMQIPTKTVSFDPKLDAWGLNIARVIRRKNENIRWASPRRNASVTRAGDAGTVVGIQGLTQGVGLDIKPFMTLTYDANKGSFDFDPGGDLFYKLSPAVTASLTINTDFAETEVDERVINLTRFPTFFPEKRDFFLQDEGIFSFGGVRRSPLAFFSRRIGIVDGEAKDILAGAKITGRSGGLEFGALDVQMKHDDALGDKNLGVLRTRYTWDDVTSVGFIGTMGDPGTPKSDNGVVGFDLDYDNFNFDGQDNRLHGTAYFLQSFTGGEAAEEADGDGTAWGARLDYPNDPLDINLFVGEIEESFNPALGFVQRAGERELFGRAQYTLHYDNWLRRIEFAVRGQAYVDLDDNRTNSASVALPQIEIEFDSGDEIDFEVSPQRERLTDPFDINDGVVIPVGAYDFTRYRASFRTSSGRPLSGNVGVEWGDFYDGHREEYEVGLEWRASAHVFLGIEYAQNEVTLPDGSFVTRLVLARINLAANPYFSWSNFIQYDNQSDSIALNSRVRWTITPGSDLFFVVNQGFIVDEDNQVSIDEDTTTITAKIAWTFRF